MVVATLTSKGQITIPKEVRTSLHLRTGDRIAFFVQDNAGALIKPLTKSVDDVFGRLHDAGQPVLSVEDMHAAVAKRMKERCE